MSNATATKFTSAFCLRCGARVDGLAHPHNCPGS